MPDVIRLSRRTLRVIRGTLICTFCYGRAALPLAVFNLINPLISAALMVFSSLFVVRNSPRR